MTVYWEYVFVENFLLDGLLLYLSLKCARHKVYALNLLLAAGVGAAEALVFPLLSLPVWAAYAVKFLGGALISVLSVRKGTAKTHLVAGGAFFFFTFVLGGLLTAVYSFFGAEYSENGFVVERAPVALVLSVAGIFAVAGGRLLNRFFRYRRLKSCIFDCVLRANGREVRWKGFSDSGNLLVFRGEPVSLLSPAAAIALLGSRPKAEGTIVVGTVNGQAFRPVYRCDELILRYGKEERVWKGALLTPGEVRSKEYQIILHSRLAEDLHETVKRAEKTSRTDGGKRERRKLSVRKRGASAPSLGRGRGGDAP